MPVALATVSALLLGTGDFLAGLGGRRVRVTGGSSAIAWIASVAGTVVSGAYVLVFAPVAFGGSDLAWALFAGILVSFARPLLYLGMTRGPIVVFAPVFALVALIVPSVLGPALGQPLSMLEVAGIVVAFPAVVLVSSERRLPSPAEAVRSPVFGLAVLVGVVIGSIGVVFSLISEDAGAAPAFVSQAVSVAGVPLAARAFGGVARVSRSIVGWGVVIGVVDIFAVIANVLAFQRGSAAVISAVLGMTPAVTIVLAWRVLGEPLRRLQVVGGLLGLVTLALFSLSG